MFCRIEGGSRPGRSLGMTHALGIHRGGKSESIDGSHRTPRLIGPRVGR